MRVCPSCLNETGHVPQVVSQRFTSDADRGVVTVGVNGIVSMAPCNGVLVRVLVCAPCKIRWSQFTRIEGIDEWKGS